MITPAGVVKVLDFGLAAVVANLSSDPSNPANSPTLTISPTRAGMILGTAAYMSPEQARGKTVDKRADIWAFGVVLFEMLTGKPLFEGETVSDTLAQVLTKEPDWEKVPAKVRRLLEACLQKDPKQRLQAIGDWRLLLTDAQQLPAATAAKNGLPWAVAAVATVAALGLGWVAYHHYSEETQVLLKMSLQTPEKAQFDSTSIPRSRLMAAMWPSRPASTGRLDCGFATSIGSARASCLAPKRPATHSGRRIAAGLRFSQVASSRRST